MSVSAFLHVADLLPEPMLLVSSGDEVVLAANRGVEKLGLGPRALQGRRLGEIAAETPEVIAGYLRQCSRSGQLFLGSLTILGERTRTACRAEGAVFEPRSGGEPARILLRLLPKETTDHRFLALTERIEALNREIARRRAAEEEVLRQREWLRVTVQSIGDAVIATGIDGTVVFMNSAAEALTGWASGPALGRPLDDIFHIFDEETRQATPNPLGAVLAEGRTIHLANQTMLLARDGSEIAIEDSAAPIRDAEGRVLGAVLVFHDVSEQRSLRREVLERAARLTEADLRKDEFLAMLSHELRNPLAPIRNALAVLGSQDAAPDMLRDARDMISRQVRHLVRLVDDLLDISRITSGKIYLQKERVDLADLAARAGDSLRPLAEAKGLAFSVGLPETTLYLDADPVRMEQVLYNLLHNGAKFTPAGGRLWIEVTEEDGAAMIRVGDTGVGIPADLLPVIFDPFIQADRSLERTQGGLGLGLTMVRTLCEMHGGTVSAQSEGEGRGCEIVVRLPLPAEPFDAPVPKVSAPTRPRGSRKVLVVDDNEDSARSIALLLTLWGHETRVAFEGHSALDAARDFDPEVFLLDIGLPGLDGFELARQLRARGVRALLVALTGYGRDEDRERSKEAGFDQHLVKPIDPDELREILATAAPPPAWP